MMKTAALGLTSMSLALALAAGLASADDAQEVLTSQIPEAGSTTAWGQAIMVVDNTQGGDAIISTKPGIKRVEDLAGKSVALLEFTPSHGMLIDAVENSSLFHLKQPPPQQQRAPLGKHSQSKLSPASTLHTACAG